MFCKPQRMRRYETSYLIPDALAADLTIQPSNFQVLNFRSPRMKSNPVSVVEMLQVIRQALIRNEPSIFFRAKYIVVIALCSYVSSTFRFQGSCAAEGGIKRRKTTRFIPKVRIAPCFAAVPPSRTGAADSRKKARMCAGWGL